MSDTKYCSVCRERIPTADTNHPCDHIWWCEKSACWSTPDEPLDCVCEDCKVSSNRSKHCPAPQLTEFENQQWMGEVADDILSALLRIRLSREDVIEFIQARYSQVPAFAKFRKEKP